MLARAYITSYQMPIIITRGNNVYGPHQFPEKMIPKFTLLASRGADLPVHGDGKALRRCGCPQWTGDLGRGGRGKGGIIVLNTLHTECAFHDMPIANNCHMLRSFLYVEDVAHAFDVVLHAGVTGETYNIGTQKERSVSQFPSNIPSCV